jgi:hypothetical protein
MVRGVIEVGKDGAVKICSINFDEVVLSQISGGTQACTIVPEHGSDRCIMVIHLSLLVTIS